MIFFGAFCDDDDDYQEMFWYYSVKPLSAFCWKLLIYLRNNIFHFHSNYNKMPLWKLRKRNDTGCKFNDFRVITIIITSRGIWVSNISRVSDCQIVSQPNKQFIFSRHDDTPQWLLTLLTIITSSYKNINLYILSKSQIGNYMHKNYFVIFVA